MTPAERAELVTELEDAARDLSATAWRRLDGGLDCSLSAILAQRAAAEITRLSEEVERLKGQDWQPIETAPSHPMAVLLFYARIVFRDSSGTALPAETAFGSHRDERVMVGFWDGWRWGENGTGHDPFERDDPEGQPTHWCPLPTPPASQEGQADAD